MKQVYLLKSDYTGYYKIGVSKNPAKRIKQLQTGTSENIEIVYLFDTDIPYKVETAIHNFLSLHKVNREWYNLSLEHEIGFLDLCQKIERNIKIVLENTSNI